MSRSARVLCAGVRRCTGTLQGGCSLDPAFSSPSRWFASKAGGNKHKNLSQVLAAQQRRNTAPQAKPFVSSPASTTSPLPPPTPPGTSPPQAAASVSPASVPVVPPSASTSTSSFASSSDGTSDSSDTFHRSSSASDPFVLPTPSSSSLSSIDPSQSTAADSAPSVRQLVSRLTRTEEDRQLLRRTSQLVAVFLVVSLVVNGLIIAGKWDEIWSWLLPSRAVDESDVSAEEEEDGRLAEQLYTDHQRWAQQREQEELVAQLLEEQRQQALADELHALEMKQAALNASAQTTIQETTPTPPTEPAKPTQ